MLRKMLIAGTLSLMPLVGFTAGDRTSTEVVGGVIHFNTNGAADSVTLRLLTPDEMFIQRTVSGRAAFQFDLQQLLGGQLMDGQYSYEVVSNHSQLAHLAEKRDDGSQQNQFRRALRAPVSGAFLVENGQILDNNLHELD